MCRNAHTGFCSRDPRAFIPRIAGFYSLRCEDILLISNSFYLHSIRSNHYNPILTYIGHMQICG